MAILKLFSARSPISPVRDVEVIYISDDDSDDSNDSSDEDEFENVTVNPSINLTERVEVSCEEHEDHNADKDDPTREDIVDGTQSDGGPTTAVSPSDVADATLYDHPPLGLNRDLNSHTDKGEVDDAAISFTESTSREQSDEVDPSSVNHSMEDIVAEMDAEMTTLRSRVLRLESELRQRSVVSSAKSSSKRKRTASANASSKRLKGSRVVNVSAERVCVQWDDTSDAWVYAWRRGCAGHCWVRDTEAGREEVDGEHLLCCGATMSIDIRANADWLPITVRYNDERDAFEGLEEIGGRRLEIEGSVLMDMILRGKGRYKGLVSTREL